MLYSQSLWFKPCFIIVPRSTTFSRNAYIALFTSWNFRYLPWKNRTVIIVNGITCGNSTWCYLFRYYFFTTMHCFLFCNCSAFQHVSLRCRKMSECESVAVSVHYKSASITQMSIMLSSHRGPPTENFPMLQFLCKKVYYAKRRTGSQEANAAKCQLTISCAPAHGRETIHFYPMTMY